MGHIRFQVSHYFGVIVFIDRNSAFFQALDRVDSDLADNLYDRCVKAYDQMEEDLSDWSNDDLGLAMQEHFAQHLPGSTGVSDLLRALDQLPDPRSHYISVTVIIALLEANDLDSYLPLLLPVPFDSGEG